MCFLSKSPNASLPDGVCAYIIQMVSPVFGSAGPALTKGVDLDEVFSGLDLSSRGRRPRVAPVGMDVTGIEGDNSISITEL